MITADSYISKVKEEVDVTLSVGMLINKLDQDTRDFLISKIKGYFRKKLRIKKVEVREVNTFLFFYVNVPYPLVDFTDKRKAIESDILTIIKDYVANETKNFSKKIRKNIEIKELTDIIINSINTSTTKNPEELKNEVITKVQSIEKRVTQLVSNVYNSTYILLWDFHSLAPDIVVFPDNVVQRENYSHSLPFPLKNIIENISAIQLARMCMKNLVENLSTVEFAVTEIADYFSSDQYLDELKGQTNAQLWKMFRAIFGLLSSSLQIISDILKQIKRAMELEKELKEQIGAIEFEELAEFIEQITAEMFCEKLAKKMDQLKDRVRSANTRLLEVINNIKPDDKKTGEISRLIKIFSFTLAELQILKFYTERFRDLAFFQTIPADVYVEDLMEIDVPKDTILVGKALFKTYRLFGSTVYALRGVNIELKQGEMVAIVGPSGSGKTTLLNIMSGLDTPDRGAVFIFGKNISKMRDSEISMLRRKHMGFIFQYYNLIPQLTVLENVMLPAIMLGEKPAKAKNKAIKLLKAVGLERFKDQFPTKLSGGQMQRVTIARSMINDPSILFADEPTGDLDSETGKVVVDLIHRFSKEKKMAVVFVTHDIEMAKRCDRILKIEDGRIIA